MGVTTTERAESTTARAAGVRPFYLLDERTEAWVRDLVES
jgi:hypothetical protein